VTGYTSSAGRCVDQIQPSAEIGRACPSCAWVGGNGQFQSGEVPGQLPVWPADNSLVCAPVNLTGLPCALLPAMPQSPAAVTAQIALGRCQATAAGPSSVPCRSAVFPGSCLYYRCTSQVLQVLMANFNNIDSNWLRVREKEWEGWWWGWWWCWGGGLLVVHRAAS
jgi:hypothetical protein